jgi:hypothetical protein
MKLQELKNPERIKEIINYISQFNTLANFTDDPKYGGIKSYILRNYKDDENYNWAKITSGLKKTIPRKKDDQDITNNLQAKYPQWDFSNVKYEFPKPGHRFVDGLYCSIKDEKGVEHGISNNLNYRDLWLRGSGCRKCGKERTLTATRLNIDEYIKNFPKDKGYVFDPNKFEYNENLKQKTLFVRDVICTKHDPHVVFAENGVNVFNLRKGKSGCPICGLGDTKGEKIVRSELQRLGYNVKRQKTFKGCYGFKGQRYCDLLRFDAYIQKEDGQEICVEYDGIQHFQPVPYFGGEEGFKTTQERDQVKTDYCLSNKIELIRIPYWHIDNIGKILEDKLGYNTKIVEAKPKKNVVITESQLQRLLPNLTLL